MGVFTVDVRIARPGARPRWRTLRRVMVDTGAGMTWLPEAGLHAVGIEIFKRDQLFVMANGQYVTRHVGTALIHCGEFKTVDEVVFAQPGDLSLLGTRTLEGFNAVVDSRKKKLVAAGPIPAAGAAGAGSHRASTRDAILPGVTSAPADEIRRAIDAAPDLDDALRAAVSCLAARAERYHWVGIYLLDGETLVLHNEIGTPTPHTRIGLSQGLCGAAARERQTIVVDDVREDPRYLACTLETRSEIVVPIIGQSARVFGEIDIDSDEPAAFGEDDRRLVEALAAALAGRFQTARG